MCYVIRLAQKMGVIIYIGGGGRDQGETNVGFLYRFSNRAACYVRTRSIVYYSVRVFAIRGENFCNVCESLYLCRSMVIHEHAVGVPYHTRPFLLIYRVQLQRWCFSLHIFYLCVYSRVQSTLSIQSRSQCNDNRIYASLKNKAHFIEIHRIRLAKLS